MQPIHQGGVVPVYAEQRENSPQASSPVQAALPPPSPQKETPAAEVQKNLTTLKNLPITLPPRFRNALDYFDRVFKGCLEIVGYPLFYIGAAMILYGAVQTIAILLTTCSIQVLISSGALIAMVLGALLYKFGDELRLGRDINEILTNMVSMPLEYGKALMT